MKKFIILAVISTLANQTIYSMQGETFNPRAIKLSLGYRGIDGLPEVVAERFTKSIEAIESFWHDRNSCDNVVYLLNKLALIYPGDTNKDNALRRELIVKNFHIILGSAKAARDLARTLSKKSDDDLAQMKALSRAAILQQANVNLAYVNNLSFSLIKNSHFPL